MILIITGPPCVACRAKHGGSGGSQHFNKICDKK